MTRTYFGMEPPAENAQTFALSIECPDCGTRRNFMVAKSLEGVLKRELSAVKFQPQCDKCGREFRVALGWMERREGWTVQPMEMGKFGIVEDAGNLEAL